MSHNMLGFAARVLQRLIFHSRRFELSASVVQIRDLLGQVVGLVFWEHLERVVVVGLFIWVQ